MRAVFFGTPEFAVPSLEALASRHEVALAVTQPDRPRGRGRHTSAPPVKEAALRRGLAVAQFADLARGTAEPRLAEAGAEIAVVVAYGLMVPDWLLAFFPRGVLNVHASLLPRWRGAAPVNRAIIAGDRETGVTTMRLVSRMDAGPVYLRRATPIGPRDTAGEVLARLGDIGAGLLLDTIEGIAAGTLEPAPQDESLVTFAPKLGKEEGRIDWSRPDGEIVNLVRGVNPWPGAFTHVEGRLLKVWEAAPAPRPAGSGGAEPGTVIAADAHAGLLVACAGGAVSLSLVQIEGKRPLPAPEFLRGHAPAVGARCA